MSQFLSAQGEDASATGDLSPVPASWSDSCLRLKQLGSHPGGEVSRSVVLCCHQYADDMQFSLTVLLDPKGAVELLTECLEGVTRWMRAKEAEVEAQSRLLVGSRSVLGSRWGCTDPLLTVWTYFWIPVSASAWADKGCCQYCALPASAGVPTTSLPG